jgi:major intracellular serine protease
MKISRRFKIQFFLIMTLVSASLLFALKSSAEKPLVVAIIDTGCDLQHPLLQKHIWMNPKEIRNNKDDDGNGFVDDLHGWDFVTSSHQLKDEHGHGTHIAGILSQGFLQREQSRPIQFMILKYYAAGNSAEDNVIASTRAFLYAIENGADIINYSGGGYGEFEAERKILALAAEKNILVVAAAGNENVNTDRKKYFPAGYPFANILSVAATAPDGKLIKQSNFGFQSVDVAAPGENIRSAIPGNRYGDMSGTSQATAFVTGAAASLYTDWDPEGLLRPRAQQIIAHLTATVKLTSELKNLVLSEGEISSEKALKIKTSKQDASGRKLANIADIKKFRVESVTSKSAEPGATTSSKSDL